MDEQPSATIQNTSPGWALPLISIGVALVMTSIIGLLMLSAVESRKVQIQPTPESANTAFSTATYAPTQTPQETAVQVGDQEAVSTTPPLQVTVEPTLTLPPGTPIAWTQAEKYALSWLCYYEVRGFQELKIDACLSVISTVRARYAYSNGFAENDVISTLTRPNQFNIEFSTTEPAPDPELYQVVEWYQTGMRGSCNGYLYFDSVPGGPSICVLRASNGQWIEFHNGWN